MTLSEVFPIGEWLPDQGQFNHGGANIVKNVLTNGERYKPVMALEAQSDALGGDCLGAYSYLDPDGNANTFSAYATKIKKLQGQSSSWEDVTQVSGDYATTDENVWNFTQFGTTVIATNFDNKMQKFTVGSDSDFSDLITSGPDVKCRNFGIINNFLVCVDINDSDGLTPNRVRWSPFNDPDGDWTPSASTQADYQDVQDGKPGAGMAVVGGQNFGIVFFKNAIFRMEFVGAPLTFSFHLMEENRGAVNGQSVASDGQRTFFLDESGFFLFNGVQSTPIGHRKVDRWFWDNVDSTNLHKIRSVAHPSEKSFMITFPSVSGNGENDTILIYNWADQRWTYIEENTQQLFRFLSDGWTLEDIGAEYPDLDVDVPFSLDSRFWKGGETSLGVFDADQKLSAFAGDNMMAEFETQELRLNQAGRSIMKSVLPVSDGGTAEVRLGTRELLGGTVDYTAWNSVSSITGQADILKEARYHRAGIRLSGEWENFQGLAYEAEASGGI